jgi:hypothetical protein
MGRLKLKCDVVMLPSEIQKALVSGLVKYYSNIRAGATSTKLEFVKDEVSTSELCEHQVLYFISKEKIKPGDKVLNLLQSVVMTATEDDMGKEYKHVFYNCVKIEASSDESITPNFIIPDSFIAKYASTGGVIKAVMLTLTEKDNFQWCVNERGGDRRRYNFPIEVVKTRSDNTVIVSAGKDNFTRQEVLDFYQYVRREYDTKINGQFRPLNSHIILTLDEVLDLFVEQENQ